MMQILTGQRRKQGFRLYERGLFLASVCFLSSLLSPARAQTLPVSNSLLAKKNAIYDAAMTQVTTSRWLETSMNRLIKSPLDAEVDEILAADEIGMRELPEALRQANEYIRQAMLSHLQDTTLATDQQGPKLRQLRKLSEEVAQVLTFSPKARAHMHIYAAQGQMNAYTFSGDPEQIHAVFFDELIERMNDGNLRQIIGHEFWHIRGRHIPNRLRLYAIFYATGKSVIPPAEDSPEDSDEARKEREDREALHARYVEQFLNKMASSLLSHADKAVVEKLTPSLAGVIREMGDKMAESASPQRLRKFSNKVIRSIRGLRADEELSWDFKDLKEFEKDLDRLSRAQETSCDRAGYIANAILGGENHHRQSIEAYVKLFASKFSSVEEQMKQIESVLESLGDPATAQENLEFGNSHPRTLSRARFFDVFRHETAFQIYRDPFLRVLHDYFAVTQSLIELRERLYSGQRIETMSLAITDVNRKALTDFARQLAEWLVEALAEEMARVSDTGSLPLLEQFVSTLEGMVNADSMEPEATSDPFILLRRTGMRQELAKPQRVVQTVIENFEASLAQAKKRK